MQLVTDYLDASAERLAGNIALVDGERSETYFQYRDNAHRIATNLIDLDVFKKPVLVAMDKGIDSLLTFMGIAYSGNFYIPLDMAMPLAKMQKIAERLNPEAIVTDKRHSELAAQLRPGTHILHIEDMLRREPAMEQIKAVRDRIIDTDALYVLFTSGSTGIPKGVVICHRSVIDYTEWVVATFGIDTTAVLGNQAPFYFDNSVLDIYSAMKCGATLDILPPEKFSFPVELLSYMCDHAINTIFWVPSALCIVANLRALEAGPKPDLLRILAAGEILPNKQLNAWRRHYPAALFANLYGPTEITVDCAYYIVDREFADDEPLPIGKPCRNTDIIVLDDANRLITAGSGAIGELCVRGSSLALGYYRNPEKTVEAFIQNPLNSAYPERIYRTGDLVKYNDRGELMFLSRKDFQIKHKGNRIELGEIESAALRVDGVDEAVCVYDDKRTRIVLYYTGTATTNDIAAYLLEHISDYMVPGKYMRLEAFPYNSNGKIDRIALKAML